MRRIGARPFADTGRGVMADEEREDDCWMARCAELAEAARARGNTAVGSVLARRGRLLAEASEEAPAGPDPFAHAELEVVRAAVQRHGRSAVRDATLYTTAEPCFLCSYAIREARIGRVVIARATADVGGVSSRYPILTAMDIERWGDPPIIVWYAVNGREAGA